MSSCPSGCGIFYAETRIFPASNIISIKKRVVFGPSQTSKGKVLFEKGKALPTSKVSPWHYKASGTLRGLRPSISGLRSPVVEFGPDKRLLCKQMLTLLWAECRVNDVSSWPRAKDEGQLAIAFSQQLGFKFLTQAGNGRVGVDLAEDIFHDGFDAVRPPGAALF